MYETVEKPWGSYTVIDEGEMYKVKKIVVNPSHKLSLQKHKHRSEHWIIVSGFAKVTNGENELRLIQNESTYIPKNTLHRLENLGEKPLILNEVQTGNYLGEDDIERFDDDYGRLGE